MRAVEQGWLAAGRESGVPYVQPGPADVSQVGGLFSPPTRRTDGAVGCAGRGGRRSEADTKAVCGDAAGRRGQVAPEHAVEPRDGGVRSGRATEEGLMRRHVGGAVKVPPRCADRAEAVVGRRQGDDGAPVRLIRLGAGDGELEVGLMDGDMAAEAAATRRVLGSAWSEVFASSECAEEADGHSSPDSQAIGGVQRGTSESTPQPP